MPALAIANVYQLVSYYHLLTIFLVAPAPRRPETSGDKCHTPRLDDFLLARCKILVLIIAVHIKYPQSMVAMNHIGARMDMNIEMTRYIPSCFLVLIYSNYQ